MNGFVLVDGGGEFEFDYRNLSRSFRSLLSLPIKFLSRIHRIDQQDELLRQAFQQRTNSNDLHTKVNPDFIRQLEADTRALAGIPGPFTFIMSGYAVGIVLMTLLLNRMQHLIVPSRRARGFLRRTPPVRHLLSNPFPLNLSSTLVRFLIRSPSLYLMLRSTLLMVLVLLQSADRLPAWKVAPWEQVTAWMANMPMADICWSTFIAVCASLVTSQLTTGLEGSHIGSSFNLFGYSLLLHMYSTSITHPKNEVLPQSRPDKHVVIAMLLPLLQLTVIHVLGIHKQWSRQRLIPTTIFGVLGLVHFHYVLFLSPSAYPLLNYLPSLIESFFLLVTTMTVLMNALSQILLEGRLSKPLIGTAASGSNNLFGIHHSALPSIEDDFSVAIVRLGTASFEATGIAGLGNEVVTIVQPTIHLDKEEAKQTGFRAYEKIGYNNEITNISVAVHLDDTENAFGNAWRREVRRYFGVVAKIMRHFWRRVRSKWRGTRSQDSPDGSPVLRSSSVVSNGLMTPPREPSSERTDHADYSRFLRGYEISDDEDEYIPSEEAEDSSSAESDDDEVESAEQPHRRTSSVSPDGAREAIDLLSDVTSPQHSSQMQTSMLVAHLGSQSSPVTRRRYGALTSKGDLSQFMDTLEEKRRVAFASGIQMGEEMRRNCVICTVEPRQVICWPCRCLALCEDCRTNLASRSAAVDHICPCCRTPVQGYSRIFLP